MPSYHSSLTSDKLIANIAMLTFKTKFRGPITTLDQRHGKTVYNLVLIAQWLIRQLINQFIN